MLIVGTIQVLAAFLDSGRLTHFVSHTVIIGYVSGVALALVINQLFPLLGMTVPVDLSSLFERGGYILTHLDMMQLPTALIGVGCLVFLLGLKRIDRKMPVGAIMLASVAILAYFWTIF